MIRARVVADRLVCGRRGCPYEIARITAGWPALSADWHATVVPGWYEWRHGRQRREPPAAAAGPRDQQMSWWSDRVSLRGHRLVCPRCQAVQQFPERFDDFYARKVAAGDSI